MSESKNQATGKTSTSVQTAIDKALAERGLGERPTRRVIHIEPTDAQWRSIDAIAGSNPYVSPVGNGYLFLYLIEDDETVQLYNIAPDGEYTYEALNGLHNGWTRFDSDGEPINEDDEDNEG